jgi:hypothetical protein
MQQNCVKKERKGSRATEQTGKKQTKLDLEINSIKFVNYFVSPARILATTLV